MPRSPKENAGRNHAKNEKGWRSNTHTQSLHSQPCSVIGNVVTATGSRVRDDRYRAASASTWPAWAVLRSALRRMNRDTFRLPRIRDDLREVGWDRALPE